MRKTILAIGVLLLSLLVISPFGQTIINGVLQIGASNFTGVSTFASGSTTTFASGSTVTFNTPIGLSAGAAGTPSLYLNGTPTTGFYFPATNNIYFTVGTGFGTYGTGAVFLSGSGGGGIVKVGNVGGFSFSSSTNEQGSQDTNISRTTAGVLGVGTGAQGSTAGTIAATKLQLTSFVFANIATVLTVNGQEGYCSDCTVATIASCPATQASCICAGSGSGAIARFVNSTAYCTP